MTDTGPAVDAAPADGPIDVQPAAITQQPLSLHDAWKMMSEPPKKAQESVEPPQEAKAAPEQDTAEEPEAAPEEDGGEETEASEEAQPPVDPPKFWTKEAKERWNALPRETQEYIAQRESERDRGLQKSQNELAEQRKAISAEREATDKARKDYEGKLPALMQALQDANQGAFSDIRTIDDVTKLAAEDPFRYLQWQAHQSKMAAVQQELDRSSREQETARQNEWAKYTQDQASKFNESLSDADKSNLKNLMDAAPTFLNDRGFSNEELTDLWQGKDKLSLHDHRLQSLILDGMKYRDLQKAPLKAVPKSVPPVQKPGAAQPRGLAQANSLKSLNARLSETGRLDDAVALLRAQRAANRL